MIILAHRGYWKTVDEKNTLEAFRRAFEDGYGIETDVRDYEGDLVISHNVADALCPKFIELLDVYKAVGKDVPLALNVKADGIQPLLKKYLDEYGIENYFMFDMSVPEQVVYVREGFNTFTRQSEYEMSPSMYSLTSGVWMDEFSVEWMENSHFSGHLSFGKKIGVISPEIHGNDEKRIWNMIRPFSKNNNLMLCTDIPKEAEAFFDEQN